MKILVAASEMAPYVKTGGLGDVVGALPKALARRGHEVWVFVPGYRAVDFGVRRLQRWVSSKPIAVGDRSYPWRMVGFSDNRDKLSAQFVLNDHYFGRDNLYVDTANGHDYPDNDERFLFFAHAVLQAAMDQGLAPDILHVHDWQAGLLPVLVREVPAYASHFKTTKTVLTIHNLAHQGTFEGDRFDLLNMPERLFMAEQAFEFYGKVNFLKAAIVYADKITTVSPEYAREIQTAQFGCGLEGVLQQRRDDITGILNGVDYTVWSPSRDKFIPYRYHSANLGGKKKTRVELAHLAGLPIRDKVPLIGMVSRLAYQKGFDLIEAAAERLMSRNLQMVILGTGEEKYHQMLLGLQERYPDKLKCLLRLDDKMAHVIEAGADVFLMPSLFEPCGLNQIYSLKYGTVPVVHRVGGLADTITEFDPESGQGTGFVFDTPTVDAMLAAVDRAMTLFRKRRVWTKLMKNGMQQDFSWDRSVERYEHLFSGLLAD